MDDYTLNDFYNDSLYDNYLVVKTENNIPVGVIEIITYEKFIIEMIEVDIIRQRTGIGTSMIIKAESIAKQLNFNEIYLEALENKVEFYKSRGFEIYAEPYYDEDWGLLFPMKKKIDNNIIICNTMVGVKKISISINEELKNALDVLADGEGISRSRLIESILNNDKNIKMTINSMRADVASGVYAVPSKKTVKA